MHRNKSGLTIVELLIVIVVIAILATISVVAYNGIKQRALDSSRESDVKVIAKALDMYYIDHGEYPTISETGAGLGSGVANSHPAYMNTWNDLADSLKPYISKLPVDPINGGGGGNRRVYSYQPLSASSGMICIGQAGSTPANSSYILRYNVDSGTPVHTYVGGVCKTGSQKGQAPYSVRRPELFYSGNSSSSYLKVNQ